MAETVTYPQRFEEMKRYVRFSQEDELLLAALRDRARPSFPDLVREFYDRIREHDAAHAVFQDEAQIARLQASLLRWLERVLSGPYDAAYAEKTAHIGHVHVRVGLPQRFMFSAMTLLRIRLEELADSTMPAEAEAVRRALARILDIELGLMNQTYVDALLEREQQLVRKARERDARALEHTQRSLVRAVELAGALLVGLDRQGRVVLFNPEAERVSGRRFDEVRGEAFADLLGEDRPLFVALWDQLLSGGVPMLAIHNLPLRTRSGRARYISGCMSRAVGEGDDDLLVMLSAHDVTEEQMLAERLRQSERLASIGTLAAGLAHEIRNPLNGAQLHLTFLKRALKKVETEPDVLEATEVVSSEIERLSTLVTEFLEFARPSELRRKNVSIQELCRRATERVDHGRIKLQLPKSELRADIDPPKVEQVLVELLHNAQEAIARGGGEVVLRAYREPRRVVLEVRDDGPGLSSPDAPIFDAFFSTKPGGTGLGLAVAHRTVTDHGGSIDVESKPGATTFRIKLPLHSHVHDSITPVPPPIEESEP